MTYSVVIGDLGPEMPITLVDGGGPFVLDVDKHTVRLAYRDPDGDSHVVDMDIEDPTNGVVQRTWLPGDLPAVGLYRGLVQVTRDSDNTYPRTFPNDGTSVLWWVFATASPPRFIVFNARSGVFVLAGQAATLTKA